MNSPGISITLCLSAVAAGCAAPQDESRGTIAAVSVLAGTGGAGPIQVTWSSLDVDTVPVEALQAWVTDDGNEVAWVGRDGGGGYENEGQALHLSPADAPGEDRLVVRETFMIEDVHEITWDGSGRLVLVRMRDGGAGNPHLAIVHPLRGTVYRAVNAVAAQEGGKIIVARRRGEGQGAVIVGTDTLDLADLLDAAVLPPPDGGPR